MTKPPLRLGCVLAVVIITSAGSQGQTELPAPNLDKPPPEHSGSHGGGAEQSQDKKRAHSPEADWRQAGPVRGQLRPARWTVLAAGRGGRIKRLPAELGDRVAEGETVAVFDCAELRARRRKADARLQGAREQLEIYEELDSLQSVGQLKVHKTRNEVAMAEAQMAIIEARLRTCRIEAPYEAEVVDRRAESFQYVSEGAELVKLVDNTSLRLEAVVNSRWLSWLEPGARFRMALDELDRTLSGRVSRLGAEADPVSQTVKIVGTFDDLPAATIAGMSGDVWFRRPDAAR